MSGEPQAAARPADPSSARLVATLGFAGLLSGLIIVSVYEATLPRIEAYKAKVLREAVFEVLPQENFGLNYDPSHLLWQGIDYLAAVEKFADRIFHTHAKDCAVNDAALRRVGVQGSGWWRYTIPGTGRIAWGEYLGKLREVGFDGAVSIEHEDRTLGAEEGFRMGAAYLRSLLV